MSKIRTTQEIARSIKAGKLTLIPVTTEAVGQRAVDALESQSIIATLLTGPWDDYPHEFVVLVPERIPFWMAEGLTNDESLHSVTAGIN